MDVVCTKLLNLHIIKMSMCSGSVWETVEEQGAREREASQQQADSVSAFSNGLLVSPEGAWD